MKKEINYKTIEINRISDTYFVNRFDNDRQKNTVFAEFTDYELAEKYYYHLIDIESEKMSYQF